MQTIYYETSSFISHEDNVVDLSVYRQKLAAVSGGDFAPAAPQRTVTPPPAAAPAAPRRRRVTRREQARRRVLHFWLDVCASGAVLLFSITAMVQFLRLA